MFVPAMHGVGQVIGRRAGGRPCIYIYIQLVDCAEVYEAHVFARERICTGFKKGFEEC